MKKHFLVSDQKFVKRKRKRSIENNLNTQTQVHRSTYIKTALRNQVFSYNQDELLKDDDWLNRIWELLRWITLFLLILRPKFPWFLISMKFFTRIINKKRECNSANCMALAKWGLTVVSLIWSIQVRLSSILIPRCFTDLVR